MAKQFNDIGQLVLTAGVYERCSQSGPFTKFVWKSLFNKYMKCDWGSLGERDKRSNDHALKHGERILAQYDTPGQPRIWIITEWDRSVTTILFPEEY